LKRSQALVAHPYNPSYSGDRDQEDLGLKPRAKRVVQVIESLHSKCEALSSNSSTSTTKKKKKKREREKETPQGIV
jgi:hypothetical protein